MQSLTRINIECQAAVAQKKPHGRAHCPGCRHNPCKSSNYGAKCFRNPPHSGSTVARTAQRESKFLPRAKGELSLETLSSRQGTPKEQQKEVPIPEMKKPTKMVNIPPQSRTLQSAKQILASVQTCLLKNSDVCAVYQKNSIGGLNQILT